MRRSPLLVLAGLALGACAGSGGAPSPEAPAPEAAPPVEAVAVTPPPAAPAAPAPERAVTSHAGPSAPATQPARAAAPAFVAGGTSQLALELSAPFDIAGFELHLSFPAADFKAGQPEITDQLQGFLCAANPDIVGGFKYICAKVPARRAQGLLATVPISWSERPPTLDDLTIEKLAVVDVDSQAAPEGVELRLTVQP